MSKKRGAGNCPSGSFVNGDKCCVGGYFNVAVRMSGKYICEFFYLLPSVLCPGCAVFAAAKMRSSRIGIALRFLKISWLL